jgi:sugar lactone lactonase YvrE
MSAILLSLSLFLIQAHPAVPGRTFSPELLATIGRKGTGPGEFLSPGALTLDERGTLYVADAGNNRIQAFDSLGTYLSEIPGKGLFRRITGLALSGTAGLLVSDLPGSRMMRLDRYGVSLGDFYKPEGVPFLPQGLIVARSGDVVVCEKGSHRILVLSGAGSLLRSFGGFGTGLGNLSEPMGVAVSEPDKTLWVAEWGNNRIQSFSTWGEPQSILGKGRLKAPESVTLDGKGRIWVADTGHDRVAAFSEAGEEVGEIKGLARPGFVLCSGAKLYVSDTGNHRVLIYDLEGP